MIFLVWKLPRLTLHFLRFCIRWIQKIHKTWSHICYFWSALSFDGKYLDTRLAQSDSVLFLLFTRTQAPIGPQFTPLVQVDIRAHLQMWPAIFCHFERSITNRNLHFALRLVTVQDNDPTSWKEPQFLQTSNAYAIFAAVNSNQPKFLTVYWALEPAVNAPFTCCDKIWAVAMVDISVVFRILQVASIFCWSGQS